MLDVDEANLKRTHPQFLVRELLQQKSALFLLFPCFVSIFTKFFGSFRTGSLTHILFARVRKKKKKHV